jgi:hypothetical protein
MRHSTSQSTRTPSPGGLFGGDSRLRIKLEGNDANQRDALGDLDGLSIVGDDGDTEASVDFDDAAGSAFDLNDDELDIGGPAASPRT